MHRVRICLIAATIAAAMLTLSDPTVAQAPSAGTDEHAGYHPQGAPSSQPALSGSRPATMDNLPSLVQDMMRRLMSIAGPPYVLLYHTEGYLSFLKTELEITAEQASLWAAFAEATRQASKTFHEHMMLFSLLGPAPSWPDRLADQEKALTVQLEALKTVHLAVVALYAGLTPDQKKKADDLTAAGMELRM